MWWLGIVAAVCSGILMSVQGVCNTGVSEKAGLWVTGAFVSLSAAVVCWLIWMCTGRDGNFGALGEVTPQYQLLGGVFGAVITGTVVYSISQLGTAKAELVIVAAQLAAAYVLALTGWLGSARETFAWQKLAALAVTAAGVIWYNL